MHNFKKTILLVVTFFIYFCSIAQSTAAATQNEATGLMRSEGKIYVVMAVVITILAGLLLYMLRLEKKISTLEKDAEV